jgi:hypothetical protein
MAPASRSIDDVMDAKPMTVSRNRRTSCSLAGSNPVTYSLPNLKSAVLYDDFEGHIGMALGLDHTAAYTVTANGNEVTVDVAH